MPAAVLPAVALVLTLALTVPDGAARARQLRADAPPTGAVPGTPPAPGTQLRDTLALGTFQVPLPPGLWTVYFAESGESEDGMTVTDKVGLLALEGDTVTQEIYARADRQRDGKGFRAFPYCRDASYLHEVQHSNLHTRDQDCWHIRSESLVERADAGPRFQALYARADADNLFLPATTVGARFHFANGAALLRVSYSWNPELMLRARTGDKVWLAADWSKGEVSRDPRRAAVMRILQHWGTAWYDRLKTAFLAGVAALQ